jgi:hypothetical protein
MKPRVAYRTSSGRSGGSRLSALVCGQLGVGARSAGLVGAGRVVEHLALIVIALPTDKTGVMPGLGGARHIRWGPTSWLVMMEVWL